jgi:hypothetical protein
MYKHILSALRIWSELGNFFRKPLGKERSGMKYAEIIRFMRFFGQLRDETKEVGKEGRYKFLYP